MSIRRKWRRWCRAIEDGILEQYKYDKVIYEGYMRILESNKAIQSPPDFHNWCCRNYGKSQLLCIRNLSDKDPQTYSIQKLIGSIARNYREVTKHACLYCYRGHHKRTARDFWDSNIGANHHFLPRGIPLMHIDEIKLLTEKAVKLVNNSIAHFSRTRRRRVFRFEQADKVIYRMVEILYFYSVLIGGKVACDVSNYVILYDWKSVFRQPWEEAT